MGRTIAEVIQDKGRLLEKRETLLRQLRIKFKTVPEAIEVTVRATTDRERLTEWSDALITARKLTDIPFGEAK